MAPVYTLTTLSGVSHLVSGSHTLTEPLTRIPIDKSSRQTLRLLGFTEWGLVLSTRDGELLSVVTVMTSLLKQMSVCLTDLARVERGQGRPQFGARVIAEAIATYQKRMTNAGFPSFMRGNHGTNFMQWLFLASLWLT